MMFWFGNDMDTSGWGRAVPATGTVAIGSLFLGGTITPGVRTGPPTVTSSDS